MQTVLLVAQNIGGAFTLDAGWNEIRAGVLTGGTLPDDIVLQTRHRTEEPNNPYTEWLDTDVTLSAANGWQATIFASAEFQYRVRPSAAGANAVTSPIASTKSD